MPASDRSHALDHIVVVLFENRSLDNVLGHLYGPGDGKSFDGVIGKDLSNPIPAWAEHGAERKVVPYTVATELGFTFDRSGYRVPAIIVSPWVEPGSVCNEEYRHTSLIATLRKAWGLGEPFTERDATARTFDHLFSLATPRDRKPGSPPPRIPCPDGRWTPRSWARA
jgi:phospholipase C